MSLCRLGCCLKIHITKTQILTSTLHLYYNFEAPTKNPLQTPKNNGEVPHNRLIMNIQLRNNNGGVAPNKLIIDEQFKNNMQECFSKK